MEHGLKIGGIREHVFQILSSVRSYSRIHESNRGNNNRFILTIDETILGNRSAVAWSWWWKRAPVECEGITSDAVGCIAPIQPKLGISFDLIECS